MKILVAYACGECGRRREHWMVQPVAAKTDCECGGSAKRRFGIGLLSGATREAPRGERAGHAQHSCASHAGIPGSCVLTPTATRALAARARGDQRALDAEFRAQERAIAAGTLDPAAPIVTASPAHAITHPPARAATHPPARAVTDQANSR